jgi:hypothetical protein
VESFGSTNSHGRGFRGTQTRRVHNGARPAHVAAQHRHALVPRHLGDAQHVDFAIGGAGDEAGARGMHAKIGGLMPRLNVLVLHQFGGAFVG